MIGRTLRAFRHEKDWTQSDIARLLGVTQAAVARYERSKRPIPPTIAILVALMRDEKIIKQIEKFLQNSIDM